MRTTIALLAALCVSLAAGVVVWGISGDEPPTVSGDSGCAVKALRFTVTDDPEEFARQQRFEVESNVLPHPGYYERTLEPVSTLHAASHAYVVVFARDDVGGDGEDGLKALNEAAVRTKAPVVVSHRAQQPALVALSRGYQLTCSQGGAAQAAEVRRFAAQEYASLADPNDTATGVPAPTTPNDAPSPARPQA